MDILPPPVPRIPRWAAAAQVVLIFGIPTQLLVFGLLVALGMPMGADGTRFTSDVAETSLQFFAVSALLDTALVAIFIRVFLMLSGEAPHAVFLGDRPTGVEFGRGLILVPVCWIAVAMLIFLIGLAFPGLHNVPQNPYRAFMQAPIGAAIFIVVVVLAGGVREELQRAFILHRFAHLGGRRVGLVVFSVTFGLMHLPQGFDVAIVVGLLGVFWGLTYLRRRSVVAPIVSHAGFDVVQVLQQLMLRGLTG